MIKINTYIKVSILLLGILFIATLIGCTPSTASEQSSPTFEALTEQSPTAEDTSIPASHTATHTPGDASSPTTTRTSSPTIDNQTLLTELSIDETHLQFTAIKRHCHIPATFTLSEIDPACVFTGIVQGEFINFFSISQYERIRINYAFTDGVILPELIIENTMLAVYQYQQDRNFTRTDLLFEVPLMIDQEQPNSFYVDLDLIALLNTGRIAFHVVLQGYQGIQYRTDKILFYEPQKETATISVYQPIENQIMFTRTSTPQPTDTQPPPTATQPPAPTSTSPPG